MRRAFTLIEMLVALAIIVVLASILLPVISRARGHSDRVACRGQLRDLGAAFVMYFTDSRGRLPAVNAMPSVQPPLNSAPALPKLLQPYIHAATNVFRCRADQITKVTPNAPAGFDTYFDREGSSYQYNPFLVLYAGKLPKENPAYGRHPELVTILDEYEPFHGKPGATGSMNHLFGDMHVGAVGE